MKITLADIPMTGLSAYIANLAKRHDVVYVRTGSSALAEVITRLTGDDVKPDETEKLVIALRRANVINGQTMVTLLGRYFDEKRNEGNEPLIDLPREIERAVHCDDGLAAKSHLAAGRAIYYGDPQYPGQIVKEHPDGRRQLVEIDEKSVVTIIKEI